MTDSTEKPTKNQKAKEPLTKEEIKKLVEARVAQEIDKIAPPLAEEIPDLFWDQCLDAGQLGAGIAYAIIHRGQYAYNATTGEWLKWDPAKHWAHDESEEYLAAVENVSMKYAGRAAQLGEQARRISQGLEDGDLSKVLHRQGLFLKEIKKMRSERYRAGIPKFARTNNIESLSVPGDQFNKKLMSYPVANGVVDLRSGRLNDSRPSDYFTTASPYNYLGISKKTIAENAPKFLGTLRETFSDKTELIDFFQRSAGCWLSGSASDNRFWTLSGDGRNGKTVLVEGISNVMGHFARAIPSEMLLEQRIARSAAAPSPDIMLLKDLRLAIASESSEGRHWASSKVKWLSGSDELVGRSPHDKHLSHFKPSHSLVLLTNSRPQAPAWDYAFWERLLLIPFTTAFVDRAPQLSHERRANKNLMNELKKEGDGILSWLVEGCLLWQKRGLDPPPIVLQETEAYRRDEDLLADFIEDVCFLEPVVVSGSTEIYRAFEAWYLENVGKKVPSQNWLSKQLRRRFERKKINGRHHYVGIAIQGT
ncbi:MAG: DNA primase [Deltaproteobacteria bacterium]|nr:DNA primase [Deltaproteobacteria bacterium]